ncbi:MAG: regulatory signaling modulator protein AmpE [Candidatus Rariloculaceae bacterium]
MKLIALILGLGLEHVATQVLHLRELHWFDRYFDLGLERLKSLNVFLTYIATIVVLVIPLVPVLWASIALRGAALPWDLPYLLFAVLVVFFCLGPRDIGNEVDEYCSALSRGDTEKSEAVLTALCEGDHSGADDIDAVEEAIFVQATNRIFGVVFWFIVLGPVGAWLFRVSDLLRQRVAYDSARQPSSEGNTLGVVEMVHGILVWIPARLAVIGYALSGSFDDALNCWRKYELREGLPFHRSNDEIVACVGKAAMTGFLEEASNSSAAARNAMRLVTRTLFIWVTVISVMTLFGWAV